MFKMKMMLTFIIFAGLLFVFGCENRDSSPSQIDLTAKPDTVYAQGDSVWSEIMAHLENGDGESITEETVVFEVMNHIGNIEYYAETDSVGDAYVMYSAYQTNPPGEGIRAIIKGMWEHDADVWDTISVLVLPVNE